MAQFEIEIKLPLKNLKETLEILTDQGFHETAEIREEDTYFNSIYHDVKKRDEALRIRTSTDCRSGISKTQINFKGPKLDKVSMSRMELETEVSDTEVLAEQESEREEILSRMEDLLAILGYHMSDTVQTSYLSMLQKKAAHTEADGYLA